MSTDMSWHKKGAVRHHDADWRKGGKPQCHAKRRGGSASEHEREAKIRKMKAAARTTDKIG